MKLGHDARKYIVQQIKNSLSLQGGNFTNRDGELHAWFIEHLEGISPLILIDSLSDKRLLNMVFCDGYQVKDIVQDYGVPKTTVYHWITAAFDRMIDVMPEGMATAILDVKLKQYARARLKSPKEEDGAWLLARDVAGDINNGWFMPWRLASCVKCGGSQFMDYIGSEAAIDWCCLNCGYREPYRKGRDGH